MANRSCRVCLEPQHCTCPCDKCVDARDQLAQQRLQDQQQHTDAPICDDEEAPRSSPRFQRFMAQEKGYDD